MKRLLSKIKDKLEQRFIILYGFGLSDSFLTENFQELQLDLALLHTLKGLGYKRILYLSPQNPLHFLDEESKILSRHIIWEKRQDVLENRHLSEIQQGPFGNIHFFQQIVNEPSGKTDPIGDIHALRLVDYLVQEINPYKTAIIIDQADIFLSYFEDQRSMASIIGKWLRLPSYNSSQIFFVISSPDFSDLISRIQQLPLPELTLLAHFETQDPSHPFILVEGPEQDECHLLLQYFKDQNSVDIPDEEFRTLSDWMTVENQPLKIWMARLSQISSFSIETGKQKGWFQAFHHDSRTIEEKLNELIGLTEIKTRITELSGWIQEKKKTGSPINHNFHMVFIGHPGTGKTTMARIIGEIFKDLGILQKGHLVEAKASDLIAEYVGGTAIKTNSVIDKAQGGVLFIDEAYSLSAKDRGGFGQEAIETLLIRMENERNRFIVILAGYPQEMNDFIESNPGLSRRFPVENRFYFPDFSEEELFIILRNMLNEKQLNLTSEMENLLKEVIHQMVMQKNERFGNAGEMRNLSESIERKCLARYHFQNLSSEYWIAKEDISDEYIRYLNVSNENKQSEFFEALEKLKGLWQVKNYVKQLFYRVQFEKLQALSKGSIKPEVRIPHLVFVGNPGTGKTTVARLISRFFHQIGFLHKGHLIEVTAADLIAGYVGQTPEKTSKVIKSSLGGVLFIDEAYSLIRGSNRDHYGLEVIDLLVKTIDRYEGQLCIILAGYPEEMSDFLRSNPGLKSRFDDPIFFEDLSIDHFIEILRELAEHDGLILPEEVIRYAIQEIEARKKIQGKSFGNAREVIKVYEKMKDHLALRVIPEIQGKNNNLAQIPGWNIFQVEDILESSEFIHFSENQKLYRNS